MAGRLTLRARLLLAALLAVGVGLTVAFVASSAALHTRVLALLDEEQRARAVTVLELVQRGQQAGLERLETWARTEDMATTLDTRDPKFAEDYLLRTINGSAFAVVALLDASGAVLCAVQPAEGTHGVALERLRGLTLGEDPSTAGLFIDVGGTLHRHAPAHAAALKAVVPIKDFSGDVVGALVAFFSSHPLRALLRQSSANASLPITPVLLEPTNSIVVGLEEPLDEALLRLVGPLALASGGPVVARGQGLLHGVPVWVSTARQADAARPDWRVALLVNERDVLAPLTSLRQAIALAFLGSFLLVVFVGLVALRRVSEPLERITTSMERVAAGDLSVQLPPEPAADLDRLVRTFNGMVRDVSAARDTVARTEALRREVELARKVQASVLPKRLVLPGYDVAARSQSASEVGGDFYDVIPTTDGFFVLVGDVSGHGLNAGLIMLMVQAAAQSAVRVDPSLSAAQLFTRINAVIYENVRGRLGSDDYVTLVVLKGDAHGRLRGAGSHCPLVVARGAGGPVEVLDVLGPWCGVSPDVSATVTEFGFELAPGDALLLYTDGLTEAALPDGELFGEERLFACFGAPSAGVQATVDALFAAVEAAAPRQDDDRTAVVMKRRDHG